MADTVRIRIDGDDRGFRKTLSGLGKVAKTSIVGLTTAVGAVSAALVAAGTAGVRYNATVEQLETSFEVMTGSAEKAAEVVRELRDLGASTPYDFAGLASTTQTLMQYSLTSDEAISATKMIGDIAQGSSEKMSRIAMAYGQMSSAGKVSLEDVKQMIEAGFNPLLVISEQTGESMASLYDRISKGTLTVEELTNAMVVATSEGGMFFQSMEKQSQTLNGQLSTLQDNLQTFGGTVFSGISESLTTSVLPAANAMIEEFNSAFERGGVDGLMRAIEKKIPQLITSATNIAKNVISGVSKRIPSLVSGLFSSLPEVLGSGFDILTTLSDTLFDTLDVVVMNLVERFPEYAPVILEGVGKLAMSILSGADQVMTTLFRSIFGGPASYELNRAMDRMLEGVDDDRVAEMSATITADIDTTSATETISTALDEVKGLLAGFDIDESAIIEMIGQDYQAVYDTLIGFGVPEGTAEIIAGKITGPGGINEIMQTALNQLSVNIPQRDIWRLFREANGNRATLIEALRRMGLSETQIQGIIGLYNGYAGTLSENLVSLTDTIATTLTDGEADTEEVINALTEQANTYYEGVFAQIDNWEQAQIDALDPEAPDYATAMANIKQKADDMRTSIEESQAATLEFITSCAGKSTEEVQARMSELDEIEARVQEVTAQMDTASAQMTSLEQIAYRAVVAGADSDDRTVGMAIDFAVDSFKLDQQALEDAYYAARDQALYDLENGVIDEEQYQITIGNLKAQFEGDTAANQAEYEAQLRAIFMGIADSMPDDVADPLIEAAGKIDIAHQILAMFENLGENESFNFSSVPQPIQELYDQMFYEGAFENAKLSKNTSGLMKLVEALLTDGMEVVENTDFGQLGVALTAATEQGIFDGTEFSGMDMTQLFASLLGAAPAAGAEAIAAGEPQITAATETAVSGVKEAADVSDKTFDAGVQTINGYAYGIASREDFLNRTIDRVIGSVPTIFRNLLEVKSPSRVTMRIGEYTGEGFEIGIVKSLKQAVTRAENMVGSMNLSTRITAPALSGAFSTAAQDIADAESGRPIVMTVDGKVFAEVTAQTTRTAQNAYSRSIALGVGKG